MIGFHDLWAWGFHPALAGSIVLATGSGALLLTTAPVRRARLVLATMVGCLLAPALVSLPGLPRWWLGSAWSRPVAPPVAPGEPLGAVMGAPMTSGRQPLPTADSPIARGVRPDSGPSPPPGPVPRAVRRGWVIDGRQVGAGIWLIGVAGLGGWWIVGQLALAQLVWSSRPAPENIVSRWREIAGPDAARTRLLVADRLLLPVTFTLFRPTVLLPTAMAQANSTAELDFALTHEWSHVERGDYRAWTLASLVATLWWFCPLGWFLRRDLRLSQDFLADDRATQAGSPLDMAAWLVRLARSRRDSPREFLPLPALGISGRRSHLHRRVAMLVADRPPLATRCRPVWTGLATALVGLVAVAASGLRLDAAPRVGESVLSPSPPASAKPPALPLAAGHEWSGVIIDQSTGQPIAGAQVRVNLQLSKDPKTGGWSQIRDMTAVTPADGTYHFTLTEQEQAEHYLYVTLFVDHPDHVNYFGGYSFAMILKNIGLGERPFFEKLSLAPAAAVSGQILRPDGAPAPEVRVNAYSTPVLTGSDFNEGKWSDTRTDAEGRFRLPLHRQGQAVVWLLPVDFEPVTVPLRASKRGDLGTFRLNPGIRITGKVIDEAGQPVGGVYVNAGRMRARGKGDDGIPSGVADNIQRSVVTTPDGNFTMTPLPPGDMSVELSERGFDPATRDNAIDLPNRPLPGVFLAQKLTLEANKPPEPLLLQAVPSVLIAAQCFDSKGVKRGASQTWLSGQINGGFWSTPYEPTPDGTFTMRAPRGLENASFDLITNEHGAMMHRFTHDGPMERGRVQLGLLDHDITGIEIIRYNAPVILMRAIDPSGKLVPKPRITVDYTTPKTPGNGGKFILGPDQHSDVNLEGPQEDGRFRTSQLAPEHEVEIMARADGFAPATARLTLPEGKTEELTLTLQPK